ncbi:hypothetical protein ABIA65_000507 [Mycolicibacterium sp. 624]
MISGVSLSAGCIVFVEIIYATCGSTTDGITVRATPSPMPTSPTAATPSTKPGFADLVDEPSVHISSGRFVANSSCVLCAAIAHNLLRAAVPLAGGRLRSARDSLGFSVAQRNNVHQWIEDAATVRPRGGHVYGIGVWGVRSRQMIDSSAQADSAPILQLLKPVWLTL